ncbi:hypothetical protein IKH83_02175 [Candidatus Saccharibacteria bacterium]|nr:hypothetical protein [Candidatus Saccharibacteria bacterium]
MPNSLLKTLENAYPEFNFKPGKRFLFRPPKTIFFVADHPDLDSLLLHELGHASLGHFSFDTDIERLKMERAAWEKAGEIAAKLNIKLNNDLVETELDTYRDWLHQKSRCKKCGLTRYQTKDGIYHCPHCER